MKRFTANSLASLAESVNAQALPLDLPNDGWFVIAPYGEHAAPDGSYRQVFQREQAERIVATWNSFAGRAVRWVHNVKNSVAMFSTAAPVWEGHPDVDAQRWPQKNVLAQISEVRAGASGLEGRATFNADGMAKRGRGPLKPSPYWMHDEPDQLGRVFPELLLSVGLVPAPNIPNAPAWTRNSTDPKQMNQQQIAQALGLQANASWDDINAALQGAATTANALTTATANAATVQTQLDTAQQQLATITTERDGLATEKATLTTANASLLTERDSAKAIQLALTESLLGLAEKTGQITAAEKDAWKGKLTANAADGAKELVAKQPSLNTRSIGALNSPEVLATANARQAAITKAIQDEMASTKCSYDEAYSRVINKPELKGIVGAMQDPTRKTA